MLLVSSIPHTTGETDDHLRRLDDKLNGYIFLRFYLATSAPFRTTTTPITLRTTQRLRAGLRPRTPAPTRATSNSGVADASFPQTTCAQATEQHETTNVAHATCTPPRNSRQQDDTRFTSPTMMRSTCRQDDRRLTHRAHNARDGPTKEQGTQDEDQTTRRTTREDTGGEDKFGLRRRLCGRTRRRDSHTRRQRICRRSCRHTHRRRQCQGRQDRRTWTWLHRQGGDRRP